MIVKKALLEKMGKALGEMGKEFEFLEVHKGVGGFYLQDKRYRHQTALCRATAEEAIQDAINGTLPREVKNPIRLITENEECLGKYTTREKARMAAKLETQRTGREHHEFLTHYHCPYDDIDKACWTVLLKPVGR